VATGQGSFPTWDARTFVWEFQHEHSGEQEGAGKSKKMKENEEPPPPPPTMTTTALRGSIEDGGSAAVVDVRTLPWTRFLLQHRVSLSSPPASVGIPTLRAGGAAVVRLTEGFLDAICRSLLEEDEEEERGDSLRSLSSSKKRKVANGTAVRANGFSPRSAAAQQQPQPHHRAPKSRHPPRPLPRRQKNRKKNKIKKNNAN
jgi:hypothetical protein